MTVKQIALCTLLLAMISGLWARDRHVFDTINEGDSATLQEIKEIKVVVDRLDSRMNDKFVRREDHAESILRIERSIEKMFDTLADDRKNLNARLDTITQSLQKR